MRFCQMLLNGGDLDGTRILGRKTVELMTQNHLRGSALDLESSNGFGFGLGFAVLLDVPRSEVTGTVGEYNWGGYASTLFWVDPEEELIAILMTQYIPSGTYPLRADFKAALYPALID
jgi:CubicO group peptidase (beta-lactamase class C family)